MLSELGLMQGSQFLVSIPEYLLFICSVIAIYFWRSNAINDHKMYNIWIPRPPPCLNCGSTHHNTFHCENILRNRPAIEWGTTLKAIFSEPLGKGGSLHRRFEYYRQLSSKKSQTEQSASQPTLTAEGIADMGLIDLYHYARLFELPLNKIKNKDDIQRALKNKINMEEKLIVKTAAGPVGAEFILQCSNAKDSRTAITHLTIIHKKFKTLNNIVEKDEFFEKHLNTNCPECDGKVVFRDKSSNSSRKGGVTF